MTDEATEAFFAETERAYRRALRACFDQTPEWMGHVLRPKASWWAVNNHRISIPMSFSETLIDAVGGMQNLREHWEVET